MTKPLALGKSVSVKSPINADQWLTRQFTRGRVERFVEIIDITPAIAMTMLERNTKNRPVTARAVERFRKIMVKGRWRLSTEAIAFAKSGVLTDGQHRLMALVAADTTLPFTVWFGTEDDEFEILDCGTKRGGADLVAIDGMDNARTRASLAATALYLQDYREPMDSQTILAQAKKMNTPTTRDALLVAKRGRVLGSPTSLALAYVWISENTKHQDKVVEFWDKVVSGANLNKTSPLLKLRETLRGDLRRVKNTRDGAVKIAAAITIAWNTWVSNRVRMDLTWKSATSLPDVL
jgi:hypothetical protein